MGGGRTGGGGEKPRGLRRGRGAAGCGGSHGSLEAADSFVPMLSIGLGAPPESIAGIKDVIVRHFEVPGA